MNYLQSALDKLRADKFVMQKVPNVLPPNSSWGPFQTFLGSKYFTSDEMLGLEMVVVGVVFSRTACAQLVLTLVTDDGQVKRWETCCKIANIGKAVDGLLGDFESWDCVETLKTDLDPGYP